MNAVDIIDEFGRLAASDPTVRRRKLADAHCRLVTAQIGALTTMTASDAGRILCDGTTVAQVVGHVAGWEQFTLLALGELMAGARWPQIMRTAGWVDTDGGRIDFANPDQFTGYVAQRDATRDWSDIRASGIETARTLCALLASTAVMPSEMLERGNRYLWRPRGIAMVPMPVGWYLWMAVLWHAGVEHARDVGLPPFEL